MRPTSRAAQAFKFLGDTRDPVIRCVALKQLVDTVTNRARRLDPTKLEDLSKFLNTTASPGEGRAGDLHILWSSVRASLAIGGQLSSTPVNTISAGTRAGLPGDEGEDQSTPSTVSAIKRSSDQCFPVSTSGGGTRL